MTTYKTIPEGDYTYKILTAKEETSKSKYGECQVLQMYVLIDSTVKTTIRLWLNESTRNKQTLEQFLDSLHLISDDGNVTLNGWDSLVGMEGRAHFKPVVKDQYTFYNVTNWSALPEEPPKEPEAPPKEPETVPEEDLENPFTDDPPMEGQISIEEPQTASEFDGVEEQEILEALEAGYDPARDPFNLAIYTDMSAEEEIIKLIEKHEEEIIKLIEKHAGKELGYEQRIAIKYILNTII